MSENPSGIVNGFDDDTPASFSFVIRLWKEETNHDGQEIWRGHITSIVDNQRHYFSDINQIPALIAVSLKDLE